MPDSNISTPTPDTGACADPTLPDHPVGNVLDILQRSARELGATANELAEQPPTIALFSAVEKLTADILKLREPALDAAAQETIDALLADLATYLSDKSKTATWLVAKVDSIVAEWRSAYPLQGGNLPDELRASIRRAKRKTATWLVAKVDSIVAEWRSAYPLQGGNLPDELRASIQPSGISTGS